MSKVYTVPDAETLMQMEHLVKEGTVKYFAQVWSAQKRAKGATIWDGKIEVSFGPFGEGRRAMVYRIDKKGDYHKIALLKYTPALDWCKKYLGLVE